MIYLKQNVIARLRQEPWQSVITKLPQIKGFEAERKKAESNMKPVRFQRSFEMERAASDEIATPVCALVRNDIWKHGMYG